MWQICSLKYPGSVMSVQEILKYLNMIKVHISTSWLGILMQKFKYSKYQTFSLREKSFPIPKRQFSSLEKIVSLQASPNRWKKVIFLTKILSSSITCQCTKFQFLLVMFQHLVALPFHVKRISSHSVCKRK